MTRGRIRRRLFNGIAALSLAIFILAPIAWLGSEGRDQGFGRDQSWVDKSTLYVIEDSIEWGDGVLMLERHGHEEPNITPIQPGQWASGSYPRPEWQWFSAEADFMYRVRFPQTHVNSGGGFYFVWATEPYDAVHVALLNYALAVPFWMITLLSGILPAIWLIRFLQPRDRARAGHCENCGYDLRASTDKCPECGVPISN